MDRAANALVTFYRADDHRVRPMLVRGGIAIAAGAALLLLCALTERLHLPTPVRVGASMVGLLSFGYGLVSGFYLLPRLLATDVYIGVRRDALALALDTGEVVVPWDDIEGIVERDGVVVIRRSDDEVLIPRTFGGKTPIELARALDDARRKATLKLL
mgnify:CR=1 FL=1